MFNIPAILTSVAVNSMLNSGEPAYKVAIVGLAIWAFARAYYFAFYVIEHYIDESYKFAGLSSFVRYLWEKRREK